MTTTDTPPKKRRVKWMQAAIGLLVLGAVVALAAYLTSDSFRETVRSRVVAELERMTGGKVEIQSFTWNLSQLHFEARGLTIHGLEGPAEEPYARAGRVSLRLKIISLLSRQVALRDLVIDHLALHLIVNPDGSTNQPRPGPSASREGLSTERFVDLAVAHMQVNDGALLLNQERIPFEVAGGEFAVAMAYSPQEHGYDGTVSVSLTAARWRGSTLPSGKIDLNFVMRANETEIRRLRIATGRSTLEASGTVRDYRHPSLEMQYQAQLDLPEVAKQARLPQLRAGRADLKGRLAYQDGRYNTEGTAELRGAEWHDVSMHASGIDAAFPFSITPEKIALPRFSARVFGGSAQGELQITNWGAPAAARKPPPPRGTAKVQLERMQIGQMAGAISTARLPLNKVDMAGSASGEIAASWTGSVKNVVAAMTVDVAPPTSPPPREVPISAHMQATYHGDIRTLEIATLSLGSRSVHLNASGELGSRSTHARVMVNAANLHEFQPVLDALRPGTRIPVTVEGRATFNGSVFGELDALSVRGHVELENFSTEVAFAGQPPAPGVQAVKDSPAPSWVHFDSLTADLNYSPSSLSLQRGSLRRGKMQVGFSVTTGLRQGLFDESSSQITLDLHMENAGVEELLALARLDYPLTGALGADLHITGTTQNLRGGGSLHITQLTIYGEPFRTFRSQVQFVKTEAQFNNLFLAHNGAQIAGTAAYDLARKNFRFDLTGTSIDLATLQKWAQPRFTMSGKAGFHLTGSGGSGAPSVNGRFDVTNLVMNREAVGSLSVALETRGQDLIVHGSSAFENADLRLDGSIRMAGDFPAQLTLRFTHLDFDPLISAYLGDKVTGHSSMAGSADVRGPMRRPRELAIAGDITQFSVNIENIKMQNDGPIHLALDRGAVRADQFHLVGTDTELFLRGSIQLAGDHALDLHGRGRLDLKLAQGINPNILASGPATFTADAAGSLAHPQMSGRIALTDASVSLADLPNGLSHINGSMVLTQDRFQIEKLTAQSGGGELSVGGFLALRNGLYFDLTATGKDVRLRYPPGVSASADASLRYTGSAKSSLLAGDVTITRFGMSPRFDFGVFLSQTKSSIGLTSLNPFLANLQLDVHITSTPELRVETTLAKVSGDVDLRLRGTAARPALLGRVNIAEGDVSFNGTKYRLDRGDITFSNPLVIEPVVNLELTTRVQNYDVTVGLHGTLAGGKGLNMTYRSDPPLSSSDIIALLAFGRPRGQDVYNVATPGQSSLDTANASNAILGQALDAAVSERVERIFGASKVKIDPQFIGQQSNPSARVTVEQNVGNNITLTYITNLSQSQQTVIQVEYAVDKNVSIVAVRDQYGVVGFDVHIRRRAK
jgi:translocation and assembly module TamB